MEDIMKNMQIYEPAMCCSTGLCGVSIDPELLRISTVLSTLEKNGVRVERFNLSNSPQEFIKNSKVNAFIKENGVEALPLTVLDGEIIVSGRYPKNDEFMKYLDVPRSFVGGAPKVAKASVKTNGGCCCSSGDCSNGDC
jgi:hypothetical protein